MAIIDLNTGLETDQKVSDPQVQAPKAVSAVQSGIIDLDTGEFIGQSPQNKPTPEEAGLGDQFLDLFTGELRQTESIKDLPEVITLDLGSTFENLKLRASLVATPNAGEKIALIKNNFPNAQITTDEKENIVVDFGDGRKGVLDAPGVSLAGTGETFAEIAAFIPAALGVSKFTQARTAKGLPTSTLQKVAVGGAGAGLTQTAIEGLQSQIGGTFDPSEIAIATGLGGVAETVLPAIQAFRNSRRAKAIGAETEEVAKAVESIRPTTQAQQGLEEVTGVDVPLFQAQQTQIPSELLKQRVLPQLDAGARTAAQALEKQNKAAFEATGELINTIAPEGSIVSASSRFREASKLAVDSAKQRRSAAVRPLYDEALLVGGTVDLNSTKSMIKTILDEAPKGSDFEKVGLQLSRLIEPLKEGATPTLRQLQKAKISMQDIIDGVGDKAVSGTIKGEVAGVKRELVNMMEEASPLFKQAEDKFKEMAPAVKELEDSILGQVSKVDDTQLKNIAQRIFDPKAGLTDPQSVLNAKKVIQEVDPDAWNQLLRVEMNRRIGGLEQLIEEIPGDFVGNIPGQLRRTLFGNPQQRKALMMAMNEEQKTNFKYLETVLKRASSGRAAGSPTAAFGQAIEKLKGVGGVIRDAIFKPLSSLQKIGEGSLFDRNVARLTEVMFDPKFKPQLNKLKKLNPESPASARAMIELLNIDSEADTTKGKK
jgi:hypothetical protein